MKKIMKKVISICLCAAILFSASSVMSANSTSDQDDYVINWIYTH